MEVPINIFGCVFNQPGTMDLLVNSITNEVVELKTSANIAVSDKFSARVIPGPGTINVESDLLGLKQ